MVYIEPAVVLYAAPMKNPNRLYHTGRKRPPASAKTAWAALRKPEYTALLAAELMLSKAAVSKWKHVPEDRLQAVSETLGIPRSVLRPDLPDIHAAPRLADFYEQSKGTLA